MKTRNNIIAIVIWVCSIGVLLMADVVVFFLPVILWPHAITHLAIIRMQARNSQKLLLVAMLAYFVWTVFLFAMSINEGGLGALFSSYWAAPALVVIWIRARVLNRKWQQQNPELADPMGEYSKVIASYDELVALYKEHPEVAPPTEYVVSRLLCAVYRILIVLKDGNRYSETNEIQNCLSSDLATRGYSDRYSKLLDCVELGKLTTLEPKTEWN